MPHLLHDAHSARSAALPPVDSSLFGDDDTAGPGWFDSSLALMRGLEVSEGLPPNTTLNEWLLATLI